MSRAYHRALERYQALAAAPTGTQTEAGQLPSWGPTPDPAFERSRLFEATCLVDLSDFGTAAELFDEGMKRLGAARTGHSRLAVRHAIACAQVGEPEQACRIARRVAADGSPPGLGLAAR